MITDKRENHCAQAHKTWIFYLFWQRKYCRIDRIISPDTQISMGFLFVTFVSFILISLYFVILTYLYWLYFLVVFTKFIFDKNIKNKKKTRNYCKSLLFFPLMVTVKVFLIDLLSVYQSHHHHLYKIKLHQNLLKCYQSLVVHFIQLHVFRFLVRVVPSATISV